MAKILLVDDDDSLRKVLSRAMKKAGHEVETADSGLAALPILERQNFDLMLTDIVMPEMDGIELARRAGKAVPDMRIMFITGFAAVALRPHSGVPDKTRVLSKPFHLRDLADEIDKVLAA